MFPDYRHGGMKVLRFGITQSSGYCKRHRCGGRVHVLLVPAVHTLVSAIVSVGTSGKLLFLSFSCGCVFIVIVNKYCLCFCRI